MQRGYEFKERVPGGIVAIGKNGYHEFIAMSLREHDYGYVFLWSPGVDFEDGPNVKTEEYLYLAAKSFREFWAKLRPSVSGEE